MSENNLYEMKQKLLQMQNELLRSSGEKNDPTPTTNAQTSIPKSAQMSAVSNIPAITETKTNESNTGSPLSNEIISIFKELRQNQQKILGILTEINNKLK